MAALEIDTQKLDVRDFVLLEMTTKHHKGCKMDRFYDHNMSP